MLQRRARARTKAVKVKNEILKLPNEEVGILKVEVRNSSCMQYLVSLVHLWSVINYLRGCLAQSSGVFKCCQCFFLLMHSFSYYVAVLEHQQLYQVGTWQQSRGHCGIVKGLFTEVSTG